MPALRARHRFAAVAVALAVASGCGGQRQDLLVVYSGDCQGYLDPCG